ncbi:MAG: hypothetical protein HY704_10780 [Gemmatimonadetes bacterium]|nr:hypothetical protein [Gemmatimonadota bacterium]
MNGLTDFKSAPLVNVRVWERPTSGVIAWLVQRVAALLLLILVPLKVWSGWATMGKAPGGPWIVGLHVNAWLDGLLVGAVMFHALYGIRAILIDFGFERAADRMFVGFTLAGALLTLLAVIFFVRT